MAIVARGLGQPGDGAIAAEGLASDSAGGPTIVNMSATLTGTGTLTGTLDAFIPSRQFAGGWIEPQPAIPAFMSATLRGAGRLTGDADTVLDFDAELQQLLLLGVL